MEPKTKRRMSLSEAAEEGYVLDSGILQKLLGVCGLVDPKSGANLSLLDAIRLGWYDLSKGCFINPKTGEPMSSEQAIRLGISTQSKVSSGSAVLEADSSQGSSTSTVPSSPLFIDAVRRGRIEPISGQVEIGESPGDSHANTNEKGGMPLDSKQRISSGSCISDLMDLGRLSSEPNEVLSVKDIFAGEFLPLKDAIASGLVDPSVPEIFSAKSSRRVSLVEGIETSILDPVNGTWKDEVTGEILDLKSARQKSLIMKPLSLKEIVDMGLLVMDGNSRMLIKDPVTHRRHSLNEAIAIGTLDIETKTVTDGQSGDLVSLREAMGSEIVTPEGLVKDTQSGDLYSLGDAANRGLLSTVKKTTIFEIPCVRDPVTKQNVSLLEALGSGLISPVTQTVKVGNGKLPVKFLEAGEKQVISPQVFETLNSPSGIYDPSSKDRELTVFEAIVSMKILPSGEVLDEKRKSYVPMNKVIENGSLNPEKAALLKGLYNINLTTATVTKMVRHVIKIQSTEETVESGKIGFQEALDRNLINEEKGTFTDPSTGEESSVEEAINKGILGLSSSWPGNEFETESEDDNLIVETLNRGCCSCRSKAGLSRMPLKQDC